MQSASNYPVSKLGFHPWAVFSLPHPASMQDAPNARVPARRENPSQSGGMWWEPEESVTYRSL